ncbi:hypothetical protein UFOVP844_13 [uncultured Caudovirales phage]|uniref:Uncharacterized protein n=1 Tax=uncultured Caudovirales phage TaxID=2100421 RepID=A0A6J5P814_9CAUD|nr:hypothetical protein UFOVP844_13 [uncultured Caudovirales phage]
MKWFGVKLLAQKVTYIIACTRDPTFVMGGGGLWVTFMCCIYRDRAVGVDLWGWLSFFNAFSFSINYH